MPPKPEWFHDLKSSLALVQDRAERLREDTDAHDKRINDLLESVHNLRRDFAIQEQRSAEQTKRIEEWDRRWWGLIVILIGALLSLAAGLITTLVRR